MKSNGLATILLLVPVLTVPALAIFGIPQFAPVVASPLGEGTDNDREKRLGNSARLSHDELFDDVDSFGSNPDSNESSASSNRNRTAQNNSPRSSRLPKTEEKTPSWGDDLQRPTDDLKRSRVSSVMNAADTAQNERAAAGANPDQMAMNLDRIPRYERRSRQQTDRKTDQQGASNDQFNGAVTTVGYSEESEQQNKFRDPGTPEPRPRSNHSRPSKQREPAVEELTWAAAVERLNELDIRNFRLEPGPQVGSFVFICTYTAPDAPAVSYRFEAEADQPLKAVSKVLEQIVEWRQRR